MPKEKKAPTHTEKMYCVDDLRHAEYYGMQGIFDGLYARSLKGEEFTELMDTILSRENVLLAYRNIKTNSGSKTPGTDKVTIQDIGKLSPEEVVEKVRYIVQGSKHGYRPKPVRRKNIPKANGTTRPLGIPCMWDRLVQQCIKQVMEPICEAKFSDNSFGFRPNRSVENAIARMEQLIQRSHLHYVVEFDVKGFFDNVSHSKLIRQIWAMGIHDKQLIYVLRKILTAPIRMQDGTMLIPQKGTPQGGIISPLLANIVLNELDRWVESQWEENPTCYKRKNRVNKNGSMDKGSGYDMMRKQTTLKEMFIVRYADDFRILCRTKSQAERTKIAVTQWLRERLRLEVSEEKTRVVNIKRRYAEFLGFKHKLRNKGEKLVVKSHPCDKALKRTRKQLCDQAKRIAKPRSQCGEAGEIRLYNAKVMGFQNYFCIATHISKDAGELNKAVMTVLTNRLQTERANRLVKRGRKLTELERKRYGKSKRLRYVAGSEEPIYPVGYVQYKTPMSKKRDACRYTPQGRIGLHDSLRVDVGLMLQLMRQPLYERSVEYADNRISLFSAQWGRCAVTGTAFESVEEIHCHHKRPKKQGGSDKYENLVLVTDQIHRLIHATDVETIQHYINLLMLNGSQLKRLNELRELAGNCAI